MIHPNIKDQMERYIQTLAKHSIKVVNSKIVANAITFKLLKSQNNTCQVYNVEVISNQDKSYAVKVKQVTQHENGSITLVQSRQTTETDVINDILNIIE